MARGALRDADSFNGLAIVGNRGNSARLFRAASVAALQFRHQFARTALGAQPDLGRLALGLDVHRLLGVNLQRRSILKP